MPETRCGASLKLAPAQRRIASALLLLALVLLPAGAGRAQEDRLELCVDAVDWLSPKQRIVQCDKLLKAGGLARSEASIVHAHRGRAYLQKGDRARAAQDLQQAIVLDDANAAAYAYRAALALAENRPAQALADYGLAIARDPGRSRWFRERAAVHRLQGDLERALADLDSAVRMDPVTAENWAQRAWISGLQGLPEAALVDAAEAERASYADENVMAIRGLALLLLGRREEARDQLQYAIELAPLHRQALWMLAYLEDRNGRPKAAAELRRRVRRLAGPKVDLAQLDAALKRAQAERPRTVDLKALPGNWGLSMPGIEGASGSARLSDQFGAPNLLLFSIRLGCNTLTAMMKVQENQATLEGGAASLLACRPPIPEFEAEAGRRMGQVRTVALSGPVLQLKDDQGKVLFALSR